MREETTDTQLGTTWINDTTPRAMRIESCMSRMLGSTNSSCCSQTQKCTQVLPGISGCVLRQHVGNILSTLHFHQAQSSSGKPMTVWPTVELPRVSSAPAFVRFANYNADELSPNTTGGSFVNPCSTYKRVFQALPLLHFPWNTVSISQLLISSIL